MDRTASGGGGGGGGGGGEGGEEEEEDEEEEEEEERCDVEIPPSNDVNIRSWRLARAIGEEATASSESTTTLHF